MDIAKSLLCNLSSDLDPHCFYRSTILESQVPKLPSSLASLAKASERALGMASLIMHESSPRRQGLYIVSARIRVGAMSPE